MKEFVEKLIGRLEETDFNDIQMVVRKVLLKYGFPYESIVQDEVWDALDELSSNKFAIKIINELAEEYQSRIMIDNEYCWQKCGAVEHCKECNRLGNGITDYFENYDSLVEEYNNGWIPCSELLPEEGKTVLLFTDKDLVRQGTRFISFDHNRYDLDGTTLICWDEEIVAWQPLPEPPEYQKGK
jgi:hypothetical protein